MQLSHVTAFWLRLAGNILLDLFLYVRMFCSLVAHEIIRRLILLPLARAGGLGGLALVGGMLADLNNVEVWS